MSGSNRCAVFASPGRRRALACLARSAPSESSALLIVSLCAIASAAWSGRGSGGEEVSEVGRAPLEPTIPPQQPAAVAAPLRLRGCSISLQSNVSPLRPHGRGVEKAERANTPTLSPPRTRQHLAPGTSRDQLDAATGMQKEASREASRSHSRGPGPQVTGQALPDSEGGSESELR